MRKSLKEEVLKEEVKSKETFNINEAFKALEGLEEDDLDKRRTKFNLHDEDDISELKSLMISDEDIDEDPIQMIVDLDAEDEEELQDSYEGDIILQCKVCQNTIFKNKEDLVRSYDDEDEGEEIYNKEDTCPECGRNKGWLIVGKVAPFDEDKAKELQDDEDGSDKEDKEDDIDINEEPTEDKEDKKDDSFDTGKDFNESLKTKKINESHESIPYDENTKQYLDDKQKEIFFKNLPDWISTVIESPSKIREIFVADKLDNKGKMFKITYRRHHRTSTYTDDLPNWLEDKLGLSSTNEEYDDNDKKVDEQVITDIEESLFNDLVNKYVHEIYENVDSFTTTSGSVNEKENQLILEGTINFKSGKKTSTKFIFEADSITKKGKYKFVGLNENFATNRRAFIMQGMVVDGTFLPESLTYNYSAKKMNESCKLYGRVDTHLVESLLETKYNNKGTTADRDKKAREVVQGYVDFAKDGGHKAKNYSQFAGWCRDDGVTCSKDLYDWYLLHLGESAECNEGCKCKKGNCDKDKENLKQHDEDKKVLTEDEEDLDDNMSGIKDELVKAINEQFPDADVTEEDIIFDDSRAWSLYVRGSKLGLSCNKFGAYRNYKGDNVRGPLKNNGKEDNDTVKLGELFADKLADIEDLLNKGFEGAEEDSPTGKLLDVDPDEDTEADIDNAEDVVIDDEVDGDEVIPEKKYEESLDANKYKPNSSDDENLRHIKFMAQKPFAFEARDMYKELVSNGMSREEALKNIKGELFFLGNTAELGDIIDFVGDDDYGELAQEINKYNNQRQKKYEESLDEAIQHIDVTTDDGNTVSIDANAKGVEIEDEGDKIDIEVSKGMSEEPFVDDDIASAEIDNAFGGEPQPEMIAPLETEDKIDIADNDEPIVSDADAEAEIQDEFGAPTEEQPPIEEPGADDDIIIETPDEEENNEEEQ